MNKDTSDKNIMNFADFESATGLLPISFTNDYMFRAILQKSEKVLRGLISSLLQIPYEDIKDIHIINPIIIGEAITDKEFHLDTNVVLNNEKIINLEMQLLNLGNWRERSLSYLCRSFDQLNHGQTYKNIKTTIHIGILDFTLFSDSPEFYSHYQMMNTKNHRIYSDKFLLNVLDLSQIELATEEDKQSQLVYWAKLFKSTTWEEIKSMATENEYVNEACKAFYTLSSDEYFRKLCYDRENYYADLRGAQELIAEKEELIKEKEETIKEKDSVISQQHDAIKEKNSVISQQDKTIHEIDAENARLRQKLLDAGLDPNS